LWIRHDVPQLPKAITQGETREEVFAEAADCLEEAIAARIGLSTPYTAANKKRHIPSD
jgi:predicted RNase H-like HicB family nuclease